MCKFMSFVTTKHHVLNTNIVISTDYVLEVSSVSWPEMICVGQLGVGYRGKPIENEVSKKKKR